MLPARLRDGHPSGQNSMNDNSAASETRPKSRFLNIVHVNDSLVVGASEKLTALLCREQRLRQHTVSVHCLFSIGALGEELRCEGFDIVLHRSPSAFGLMRSLYRAFKSSKPDVVHCHNTTAAVLGALPARLAGVKTIVATRHGLVKPPYQLRSELRFAVASRFCDWIVGVCDSAKAIYWQHLSPSAARSFTFTTPPRRRSCRYAEGQIRLYLAACRSFGGREGSSNNAASSCSCPPQG